MSRWTMVLGTSGEIEFVIVNPVDGSAAKCQVTSDFDSEDIDEALAELDRLHAELGGD